MALARRLHAAITRPFRRVHVDHDAHRELERRQQTLARRIAAQRRDLARIGLLGVRAEVHARDSERGES